jgi:hypothetical protein
MRKRPQNLFSAKFRVDSNLQGGIVALAAADIGLFYLSKATVQREEILTKWNSWAYKKKLPITYLMKK